MNAKQVIEKQDLPKDRNRRPWIVCLGCVLVLFCSTGLTSGGFSIYSPYLISDIGLSGVQASSIVTLRSLFAVIATACILPIYDRIGYRIGMALSVCMIAAGFFVFSLAQGYVLCAVGVILLGFAQGLGSMVTASVVIGRWFHDRRGFAVGIVAAGSGLATVIMPPIITFMITNRSLQFSFFAEGIMILIIAALVFLMIRDEPDLSRGEHPLEDPSAGAKSAQAKNSKVQSVHRGKEISKADMRWMILAYVMIGGPAVAGYSHISVLYRNAGMDPVFVSLLISAMGLALMVSKTLYGVVSDRIGGYRAGWIFHSFLIAATVLCCLAGTGSSVLAVAAVFFYGFGVPINTTGLSINAEMVSSERTYAKTMKSFQMAFQLGAMAMNLIPGAVYDRTGTYVPAFVIFAIMAVVEMLIIQWVERKNA